MPKGILATIILIAFVTAGTFTGCSDKNNASSAIASSQPVYGGQLVIGIPRDVDTFNPLFSESIFAQEITHLMQLGLADLNAESEFTPELAASWDHSPDNMSLIYHLRRDALWSDGVRITAWDVKFTFDVMMDPQAKSAKRAMADFVEAVTVVDSFTVKIDFTEAYPYQVFDTAGEILPRHILENVDRSTLHSHPYGRNPLSSGPFKLKKWATQQYIELVPNEHYFAGRPYLDKVVFKIVPNTTSLLNQLQTGEIDMMIGVPPAEVERLGQSNPRVKIYPVSGRVYYYLGYNEALPQFASKKVRHALTLALERGKIIDALLYGYGRPCIGPIPPMLPWAYNDQITPLPYDPNQAKQLLAQAGWTDTDGDGWVDRDNNNFEFTIKTDAANQVKSDLAVIIQDQLKKVGVKVNIELVEWTTYLQHLKERKFDAQIGGWSSSLYVDPTPIFHSSATDLFNYGSYANAEVDRLIEQGRGELDRHKAAKIWKELQEVLYEDQHYTFLFWIDRVVAINDRISNAQPVPLSSLYDLETWYDNSVKAQHAESSGDHH